MFVHAHRENNLASKNCHLLPFSAVMAAKIVKESAKIAAPVPTTSVELSTVSSVLQRAILFLISPSRVVCFSPSSRMSVLSSTVE